MSAFLSVDLLTDFAAFCLTDFIDWRYIHSWFVFFDPACELLPPWTKDYTCVLLPLNGTFSLTSSPLPPFPMYSILYTDSVWLWGGGGVGVLKCTVDHILQEFYTQFLTRFRTYKIASPLQTKITSKDDFEGLGSLKFLRPCFKCTVPKIWNKHSQKWNCVAWFRHSRVCERFIYSHDWSANTIQQNRWNDLWI